MSKKLTRQKFLNAVGAGAAWIALANTLGCEPAERTQKKTPPKTASSARSEYVRAFRSRSDLSPPAIEVTTQAHDTASGYVFVAPKKGPGQDGPMIVDGRGDLVWFRPVQSKAARATDFKVQRYQGEPVLTWWEGKVVQAHGVGEYVIFDRFYRELTRLRAGNGYRGDLHELLITPRDTALLTAYDPVSWDLSSVGGPEDGVVLDGIAQEVDIETGEVLFEWHSLDHVGLGETHAELPKNFRRPFDYFHVNSIDVDHDDNLLVSARLTSTVYKIDRKSGEVIWRLGGKKSDFEMGQGTPFAYQHDARRQRDGTISIFDNGGANKDEKSYGLVLELDEDKMIASLVREYVHPDKLLARTQANIQVLPNDNVFIGWGSSPSFSEFSSDGELLFDAIFSHKKNESYRAFRFPWTGQPSEDPAVATKSGSGDKVTLYTSWNGATEVATWQVLAGPSPVRMKPVGAAAPREGFETAITVNTAEPYIGVQARDGSGRVLGTSKAIKLRN